MKKRFSIISASFLIILFTIGCGQVDNHQDYHLTPVASERPTRFIFASLEEFLYAHMSNREGRATGRLAEVATHVNFASLEELSLLIGLPNSYQLHDISVYRDGISVWYLPTEALASEEAIRYAIRNFQEFNFRIYFWDSDTPLSGVMLQDGATEEDLINGRYHFRARNSTFYWAHGRNMMALNMPNPNPTQDHHSISAISGNIEDFAATTNIHDLLQFTQTTTIDLQDEALVTSLIGTLYQLTFDLGTAPGEFAAFNNTSPINIPANANIHNFVTMHHENSPLSTLIPGRNEFLGWYLDANFTEPLSNLITRMPEGDVVLYARWAAEKETP